jgi:hypothetical protein
MKYQKEVELKSTVPGADRYNYGQKWAKPVRPQKPSDATQMGQTQWTPGTMPKGGFRSVFHFDGVAAGSTKISNTDKPGRKVY